MLERASRLLERLDALFEIGRNAGTNRPGLGAGEQRAFELVAGWMREAGLEVSYDAAGNLSAGSPAATRSCAEVWSGSHLDTPPDGGRFDGALGVLAALDAVEAIAARAAAARTLAAVAFRLEEGSRFGRGVFGSRAVCGHARGRRGRPARRRRRHRSPRRSPRSASASCRATGWLEPPPALLRRGAHRAGPDARGGRAPLGVVTSIAGMAGIELAFYGRRGHAGTVPMALRSDALGAAARFVSRRARRRALAPGRGRARSGA